MKDLSGVNLCVWIEILRIIKNLVSLPFVLLYLCFDICLQWSCFWHGSSKWIYGGSFGMGGAFRHKLNLKNNLEIFC